MGAGGRVPPERALPSPLYGMGKEKSGPGSHQQAGRVAVLLSWPRGAGLEAELMAAEGTLGVSS